MTNKTYIKQRNALIGEATRYANEMHGTKWLKGEGSDQWSRTFLFRMDELAVREGLCEKWVLKKYGVKK